MQMSVTLYFTIYTAGYTLPMQIQEHRSLGDRSLKLLSNTPNPERKRRRRSLNFYLRNPLVIVIIVKHSQRQVTQIQAVKTSCYCYCETQLSRKNHGNLRMIQCGSGAVVVTVASGG